MFGNFFVSLHYQIYTHGKLLYKRKGKNHAK